MSGRPLIKTYGEISLADLREHQIWINVHTADEEQPWYDDAGEDSYRPHLGEPPRRPYDDLYVLLAAATLGDGTSLPARMDLIPGPVVSDFPEAVASVHGHTSRWVDLAPAMMGLSDQVRRRDLDALDRAEDEIFPVTVVSPALGTPTIVISDWYTQELTWPDFS
jgi:hypothetical protein